MLAKDYEKRIKIYDLKEEFNFFRSKQFLNNFDEKDLFAKFKFASLEIKKIFYDIINNRLLTLEDLKIKIKEFEKFKEKEQIKNFEQINQK